MEVFEIEHTLLFYSHETSNYLQDLRLNRLQHWNVVQQETLFWCEGFLFYCMIASVCYDGPDDVNPTHSRLSN